MNEMDRLLGGLEEFQRSAEARFDRIDAHFDRTDGKIDRLNEFKWRIAGGAALLSILLTAIAEYLHTSHGGLFQ